MTPYRLPTFVSALLLALGLLIAGCGDDDPVSEAEGVDETIVVNNDGASAWVIDGETNPDLNLEVGERYRFDTSEVDSDVHPLAFRDAGGDDLIEQGGDGAFHGDPGVDLLENDNEVVFTLTEDLADEVAIYICTVHPNSMVGDVN